jgi:thioredoxin reductase (NADPH)
MQQLKDLSKELNTVKLFQRLRREPGAPRQLVIVGMGPAGLSAGAGAGFEGIDTLLIDAKKRPGGQPKDSGRIQNFLGFPIGVSGKELMSNAFDQVTRLGVESWLGVRVERMTHDPATNIKTLILSDGRTVDAQGVLIAGGLESKELPKFPGSDSKSIIYDDFEELARLGNNKDVVIIGGSNSAAQSAQTMSLKAKHVTLMSRSPLTERMSATDINGVLSNKNITPIVDQIAEAILDKDGHVTAIRTVGGKTIPANAIGVFVGSESDTSWLPEGIQVVGSKMVNGKRIGGQVVVDPVTLETHVPGVWAAGDIRTNSGQRIGTAVGDGLFAVKSAGRFFAEFAKKGMKKP